MKTGRITLFNCEQKEGENSPLLSGEIEYVDGTKDKVSLWANSHPRVTKGLYYTGQLQTPAEESTEDVNKN